MEEQVVHGGKLHTAYRSFLSGNMIYEQTRQDMKKVNNDSHSLMLCITASTKAMSYEQARREAYFLTDKMAYELNLTPDQYDAAYEINLDYLMGVATADDVYSDYWRRRNLDMSYILLQWQWDAFCAATYFYRPLYWSDGFWHFAIYARYPRRNYFYFSRPTIYISYRGGHSWRSNGGRSYYHAHRDHYHNSAHRGGMRDSWDRGDFRQACRRQQFDPRHSEQRQRQQPIRQQPPQRFVQRQQDKHHCQPPFF